MLLARGFAPALAVPAALVDFAARSTSLRLGRYPKTGIGQRPIQVFPTL